MAFFVTAGGGIDSSAVGCLQSEGRSQLCLHQTPSRGRQCREEGHGQLGEGRPTGHTTRGGTHPHSQQVS